MFPTIRDLSLYFRVVVLFDVNNTHFLSFTNVFSIIMIAGDSWTSWQQPPSLPC